MLGKEKLHHKINVTTEAEVCRKYFNTECVGESNISLPSYFLS